jgi:hypothetical protein
MDASPIAFKNCLLQSDLAHLVELAQQRSGLQHYIESIKIDLAEIDTHLLTSDVDAYKMCHQFFKKYLLGVPLNEKRAKLELRKAELALQKLPLLTDEQCKLMKKVEALTDIITSAEEDIQCMIRQLNTTFSPDMLEKAEIGLEETRAYEESLQLAIDHIHNEYTMTISGKWLGDLANAQRKLKDIEDRLRRICLIEISRSVGRSGGPLPVYKKRAELNRLLSSNDAVIVTAQTGSGKVR